MLADEVGAADPDRLGVLSGYRDIKGRWIDTPSTAASSIAALITGSQAATAHRPGDQLWVVGPEDRPHHPGPWRLDREGGDPVWTGEGALPKNLRPGRYLLSDYDADSAGPSQRIATIIVTPGRCFIPPGARLSGVAVQTASLLSTQSWGIGDLFDLSTLLGAVRSFGVDLVMSSPMHAPRFGVPPQSSPYFPSSRCFYDPIYLRVEEVPGFDALRQLDQDFLEARRQAARTSTRNGLLDRAEVSSAKMAVLDAIWQIVKRDGSVLSDTSFQRYRDENRDLLAPFAAFSAHSEEDPRPWWEWDSQWQHPAGEAVRTEIESPSDRALFHQWLQWLLAQQLTQAGATGGLMMDLAVGVDPAGADAWLWQDWMVPGVELGAPPDDLNPDGQCWGFPVLDPTRLALAEFEPVVAPLRAAMRYCSAIRIDHVLGLFRQYWVPKGTSAQEGAYVRFPYREILRLISLESHRYHCLVIGEDLGTAEEFVRPTLADAHVLGYRVALFEDSPPERLPFLAVSTLTTHDLPTLAGLLSHSDWEELEGLGLRPTPEDYRTMTQRLVSIVGSNPDPSTEGWQEAALLAHTRLAHSPCAVVLTNIEDILGVKRRINVPGTTDRQRANWLGTLPDSLEALLESPNFCATLEALAKARRPRDTSDG